MCCALLLLVFLWAVAFRRFLIEKTCFTSIANHDDDYKEKKHKNNSGAQPLQKMTLSLVKHRVLLKTRCLGAPRCMLNAGDAA